MFDKKEKNNILATVLVIAFVFAFNDKNEIFVLNNWILNFLKVLVFSAITVLSYELAQKYVARLQGIKIYHEIRYGINFFGKKKKFPTTIIIAIILTLLTNGKFYFAAIKKTEVFAKKAIGKRYPYPKEFEISRMIAAGPISTIFLAAIVSGLNFSFLDQLKLMLILYSVYNILPIPPLDGSKIFFHSLPMFILSFVFITASASLFYATQSLLVIFVSIMISLTFFYAILVKLS